MFSEVIILEHLKESDDLSDVMLPQKVLGSAGEAEKVTFV